jgi:hypothetical protein
LAVVVWCLWSRKGKPVSVTSRRKRSQLVASRDDRPRRQRTVCEEGLLVWEDEGRRKRPSRKGMAESAGRTVRRRRKEVLRWRFSVARVVMRVSCSVWLSVS